MFTTLELQRNRGFLNEVNQAISALAYESAYLIRQQSPLEKGGTAKVYREPDMVEHVEYFLPVPSQETALDTYDGITVRGTSTSTRRRGGSSLHTVTVGVHNAHPGMRDIPVWKYGISTNGLATLESISIPPSVNKPLTLYKGKRLLSHIRKCAAEGLIVARLVNAGLEAQGIHAESAAELDRLQKKGNRKFGLRRVELIYGMQTISPKAKK